MGSYILQLDGLRALAVILIVLFHLEFRRFSGAFLGVDIFFVISGFLISKKIISEILESRFSIKDFYVRRFWRIFPALIAMVMVVFCFASLVLSPESLVPLARASIWSLFPFSNILYWSEAGYFDRPSLSKPLLHTWSLGVEEQFYLIWPVLILGTWKIFSSKRALSILFSGVVILSLSSAFWVNSFSSKTAFYWMPFRAYQFALGALAFFAFHSLQESKNWFLETLTATGILLVCVSAVFLDVSFLREQVWPSLVVGVGAVLIILGGRAQFLGSLFRNKIVRFLGTLSYSIYLVHWPVIVFFKYAEWDIKSYSGYFRVLAIIFVLALFLHFLVEIPFWKRGWSFKLRRSKVLSWVAIATLGLFFFSCLNAIQSNGWLFRYDEPVQSLLRENPTLHPGKMMRGGVCLKGSPLSIPPLCYEANPKERNILVVGSSVMASMYHGLRTVLEPDFKVYQLTAPGCACVWGCDWQTMERYCFDLHKKLFREVLPNYRFEMIVLEKNTFRNRQPRDDQDLETKMKEFGVRVVWILQNPRLKFPMADRLAFLGSEAAFQGYWNKAWSDLSSRVGHVTKTLNTFDLKDAFCSESQNCQWKNNGKLLYSDAIHFSEAGSELVAQEFKRWMKKGGRS